MIARDTFQDPKTMGPLPRKLAVRVTYLGALARRDRQAPRFTNYGMRALDLAEGSGFGVGITLIHTRDRQSQDAPARGNTRPTI